MGVYYEIFTEVLLDGKWRNIDIQMIGADNKHRSAPIIWGQSWMWEAIQELESKSYSVTYDKLSDGTKAILGDSEHLKERKFEAVDFQTAVKDRIKPSPSRRGYAYRSCIAMFQTGETDSIEECITPFDYAALDKDEQKEYSYYEWDDRDGWYNTFKLISHRIDFLVEVFNDYGSNYENGMTEKINAHNIRLVIVKS